MPSPPEYDHACTLNLFFQTLSQFGMKYKVKLTLNIRQGCVNPNLLVVTHNQNIQVAHGMAVKAHCTPEYNNACNVRIAFGILYQQSNIPLLQRMDTVHILIRYVRYNFKIP